MINRFGKAEAGPMTVSGIVKMRRTPLFQKFERIRRFPGALRLHQINGSHRGCKLGVEISPGLFDRLLSKGSNLCIKELDMGKRCVLLQIRKDTTTNEIDFETKNGILIGSGSGERVDLRRNTKYLRQELADLRRH